MGTPDEDPAEAPTVGQTTAPERASRPVLGDDLAGLAAGDQIGRYRLVVRLGAGAMGVVWAANDPQLDRRVAIKLVHPRLARSPEAATRMLREARAMAKLSHRAVITIHDAGDVEGQLFLAMELVEGTTLGAMLRGRGPADRADWRRWLQLVLEAGHGLAAAHEAGVLHRDFKPDNVLVAASGRVCVGDFGVAALGSTAAATALAERPSAPAIALGETSPGTLTSTGALLGTPAYMSPQQLRGEAVDTRADQFAFCVTAWEAIYGARPFTMPTTGFAAFLHLADAIDAGAIVPPPTDTGAPAALEAMLRRGLAAAPEARWPTMTALLAALEQLLAPAAAPRPRLGRTGLVLGGLALVVAAGVVITRSGTPPAPAPAAPEAAAPLAPTKLFDVSLRTTFAISPDGARIALGGDRVEVRELAGTRLWSAALAARADVTAIEIDGTSVRFGQNRDRGLYRWDYLTSTSIVTEVPDLGGLWRGRALLGDVTYDREKLEYRVVDRDLRVVRSWTTPHQAEVAMVSPDRRSVAYVVAQRYQGEIIVRDLDTGTERRLPSVLSPTSIGWLDDHTLTFATGTGEQPRLYAATLLPTGIAAPVEIYRAARGWFSPLRPVGDAIYTIDLNPSSRARLVERTTPTTAGASRDYDRASVGAALGWAPDGALLIWSRSTGAVERRAGEAITLTAAHLDGEPANATLDGTTLIATVRRVDGRETIALDLADGHERWRHADRRTIAARCAGDRGPPCYAIRTTPGIGDQLVTLDPRTGALGTTALATGNLEDVAVSADGTRILLVNPPNMLRELRPDGTVVHEQVVAMATPRSVAFDPGGDILVAGTEFRNRYSVKLIGAGDPVTLAEADDDILSLVRPSADGARLVFLARAYAPGVVRLQRPAPR